MLAYYTLPRLARERPVARPTTALGMAHECEETVRLATPIAELMMNLSLEEKRANKAGSSGAAKAAALAAAKAKKPPLGKKAVVEEELPTCADEALPMGPGDLHPADVMGLPVPRGLDARLMHRVCLLRSRRLKLEGSMALFEAEIEPCSKRLHGIGGMAAVGQYSLSAVRPHITGAADAELVLQRVRTAEDEAFHAKRAASVPLPVPAGRR
jgi:hypothetical protein